MSREVCNRCGKVTRPDDVHTCSPKGLPHCENSCEANAFKIEIRRLKAEKKELLEALKLALSAHGVMLMSDPPQEAWKTYGVEQKARAAIAKAEGS